MTTSQKQKVYRVYKLETFWRSFGAGRTGILGVEKSEGTSNTMNEKLLARGLEKGHLTNFPTLVLERLANLIGQMED